MKLKLEPNITEVQFINFIYIFHENYIVFFKEFLQRDRIEVYAENDAFHLHPPLPKEANITLSQTSKPYERSR